ncbi:S41 family peptidase [Nocardiopsis ganjiahuensis]|uniref:S41 family peptidase n=1 Tax=Nocardiopsis ganjiahuensis TaxID=239984 RepID=UPI00034CB496|nr:S41 family peptidase [Nocardiopsis ganjiahuensis]
MDIDALVEETGRLVAGHYVFPELGERLRLLLAEQRAAGDYRGAGDPAALAELVTGDLQSLNGDLHLRLKHHVEEIPALPGDAGLTEMMAREARERFGGVARVERLEGNVGYLELRPLLYPLSMAADRLSAALRLVADADALVIDLRGNRGGDPATVAFVCGHLFDEPTHLHTMHFGDGTEPRQSWTPFVPGPVFGGRKPLAVLTGADTFSGGEELAYELQQHGRATVAGERTRGGAHPREGFRIHPHLEVTVPTGRPVHPVSGTDWEGTGVVPDLPAAAEDALAAALARLAPEGAPAGPGLSLR